MTSHTATDHHDGTSFESGPPTSVLAAVAFSLAAILTAIGSFTDVLGPKEDRSEGMADFYSYLVVVGAIAVTTALVFGLVVRTATARNASSRGLVLAVLAVPTVLVAWSGLPTVLSVAALACTLVARDDHGRFSGQDRATLVLGAVALAGAVAFALAG